VEKKIRSSEMKPVSPPAVAVAFEGSPDAMLCGIRPLIVHDSATDRFFLRPVAMSDEAHPEELCRHGHDSDEFDQLCRGGFATRLPDPCEVSDPGLVAVYFGAGVMRRLRAIAELTVASDEGWKGTKEGAFVRCLPLKNARALLSDLGKRILTLVDEHVFAPQWDEALELLFLALAVFPPSRGATSIPNVGRLQSLLRLGYCYRANRGFKVQASRLADGIVRRELRISESDWFSWLDRFSADFHRGIRREPGDSVRQLTADVVHGVSETLTAYSSIEERQQGLRELTTLVRIRAHKHCPQAEIRMAAYRQPNIPVESGVAPVLLTVQSLEDRLARALNSVAPNLLDETLASLNKGVSEHVDTAFRPCLKDDPPALLESEKYYAIVRLSQEVADFNFRPFTFDRVRELTAKMGISIHEVDNLPIPANSIYAPATGKGGIYLRSGLSECERTFLAVHELAHWLLHFRDTPEEPEVEKRVFERKTHTLTEKREIEANHLAMISIWPSPAVAWIMMQAALRACSTQEPPIQPPNTHLHSSDPSHVELLVDFALEQYSDPPSDSGNATTRLKDYIRYFARRRIDDYNRFVSSRLFFRSPGNRNWFSEIDIGSELGTQILKLIESDSSVIWGRVEPDCRLHACSRSFSDLLGREMKPGDDIRELVDEEVPLFRWQGRNWTSRDCLEVELQAKEELSQPFVYFVLYRARWGDPPVENGRFLCRLQCLPLVDGGRYAGSLAVVQPIKPLRFHGGAAERLSQAELDKYGLNFFASDLPPHRLKVLEGRFAHTRLAGISRERHESGD